MMKCYRCGSIERQVKKGFTKCGSQRYQCQACLATYTPEPKDQGHDTETRQNAIDLYLEGMSFRAIGKELEVSPQSVASWIRAYLIQSRYKSC